jgi:hypothetical protein
VGLLVALAAAALTAAAPRPAPPVVVGPRDTTAERPVYTFRARRAIGFRCAFDSTVLHTCARRYSEPLLPGPHMLRVRSVGRRGALSRLVAVTVRVRFPVPELVLGPAVSVGAGAGVPAPFANGTWVPVTSDGTLARVAGGAVASRLTVGVPTTDTGMLDAAVTDDRMAVDRAIWTASDAGGRISAVRPDGSVIARFDVASRPGGLAASADAVWAFHFLQGTVTRIDVATLTARRLEVPGARATGVAAGGGSLWLLTTQPSRVLDLDPGSGAVRRTIGLVPPFPARRSLIDTWWLAAGSALWATLPNNGAVARINPATGFVRYIRIPYGNPFGVAVGAGSAWVATDRAVLQLDEQTGELKAATLIPRADRTGFVSIAYGYGAAWLTNYDRGTLEEVTAQRAPPRLKRPVDHADR